MKTFTVFVIVTLMIFHKQATSQNSDGYLSSNLGRIVEVANSEGTLPMTHTLIGYDTTGLIKQSNSQGMYKVFGSTPNVNYPNSAFNSTNKFGAPSGNDSYEFRFGSDSSRYWVNATLAPNQLPFSVYNVGSRSGTDTSVSGGVKLCVRVNDDDGNGLFTPGERIFVYGDLALPFDSTYNDPVGSATTLPFTVSRQIIGNFRIGLSSVSYDASSFNVSADGYLPEDGTVIRFVSKTSDTIAPVIQFLNTVHVPITDTLYRFPISSYSYAPVTYSLENPPTGMNIMNDTLLWQISDLQIGHAYSFQIKATNPFDISSKSILGIAGYLSWVSDTAQQMSFTIGQMLDSSTFKIVNKSNKSLMYSIVERNNFFMKSPLNEKKTDVKELNKTPVLRSVSPILKSTYGRFDTEAQWDVEFNENLFDLTGFDDMLSVCVTNNEIWTSEWNSNHICRFTLDRELIGSFTIVGVTGVRGFAFDGTYVYAGQNTTTIAKIDPVTRTLVGTITSPVSVRYITYDPERNGLWIGNSDIQPRCISMTGSTIATISNWYLGFYGAAYDPYTEGGPYLWFWSQGLGAGNPQYVFQYDLKTLSYTGIKFDILTKITAGGNNVAGGLFITNQFVPGEATMVGVLQGMHDRLWGLELGKIGFPWAEVSPANGTILPYDSSTIKIYWCLDEPGDYNGYLQIKSNDSLFRDSWIHLRMTIPVDIDEDKELIPLVSKLYPNYPNPFNPSTTIRYELKQSTKVSLKIYNLLGQEVRTLVNTQKLSGVHSVTWDGKNDQGQRVTSGVYFCRLEAGDFVKTRKLALIK